MLTVPTSTHTFTGANTDDEATMPGMAASFTAATNVHLESGQVFPATGNVRVPGLAPPAAGTTVGLGSFHDGSTGTAVVLYYNSAGAHRLVRYDPLGNAGAGSETLLLEWAGLNLSEFLVLQGGVIDGLLVYLDAVGEIRCINLARAAAGGYDPGYLTAEPFALHVVKVPPRQILLFERITANTGAPGESLHIIQSRAYQFSYRYRYIDGEVTVLAPFTNWLDILSDPATVTYNTIRLTLPPVPQGVEEVEILMREPEALTWQVADTVRRNAGAIPGQFNFYGQVLGAALPEVEAGREFEALWPCEVLDFARSRAFAAMFTEGYVTPEPAFTLAITNYSTTIGVNLLDPRTFHENCPYRVVTQFYDVFGRPGGCSQPKTVGIPAQDRNNLAFRRIQATLTTTGAAALNDEIPTWAHSVQFLVAPNDRTPHFIEGRVADVYAYFGLKIAPDNNNVAQESVNLGDVIHQAHQQVAVNIGNFLASGQGYVWQPGSGDVIRLLDENKEFQILGQRGDYLFFNWTGQPASGLDANGNHTNVRVEICSPNTAPLPNYYERGPVIPIVRTVVNGQEQRSYGTTSLELMGDAFLVPLFFPVINRGTTDDVYKAPERVQFKDDPTPVLVESMVPPFRLAPTRTTTTTEGNALLNYFASRNNDLATDTQALFGFGTRTTADLTARSSANLRWLDISLGGRPGAVVPRALQRVRRNIERYSGQKQQGNLINGLSRWEALNQYDKFPQEQGDITALVLADQSQTDGSVLLTLQQRGGVSQYLNQRPATIGQADQLLLTSEVIGGDNTLKGRFGCTDPASVVGYAGKVFSFCRERAELVRYNNGLVPLALTYKFRFRLEALTALYAQARVTGCFDPRREEYWLTFHPSGELPGVTVYWSERNQRWGDKYATVPTAGAAVNNELLTWDGADLHRHTPDAPVGTFFGRYTAPSVTFVAALPGAGLAKTWQEIAVRSLAQWVPTLLTTPAGQRSRILPRWQRYIEAAWRAAVRRDVNSPGFRGDQTKALHDGRVLQSEALSVTLTCPQDKPAPLAGASADYLINSGQQPNQ